jgi:murein DD-endopeptidase MepM/ murein hydrolase activator NlpD
MKAHKYIFNPMTLSYEKFRLGWKQRLVTFVYFLATTGVFATAFVFIWYNFFGSPRERVQKRELEYMKLQYEMMTDRLNGLEKLLSDMQDRDDNIYRVIFEANPIPSSVRKAGYGGADRYEKMDGYANSDIIIETAKRLDRIASQLYVQSKSYDEVFDLAKNKSEMLSSIPAIQPVKIKDMRRISSYFGVRLDPYYKVKKFHEGVDFSVPSGTSVFAAGNGKVIEADVSAWGYGKRLTIDHGFGYRTTYSHLSQFKVKVGDIVKRGQLVAASGNSGKSTAPHVHFEVHKNGAPVNPIHFFFNDLSPEEYEQIIKLSSEPSQTMD